MSTTFILVTQINSGGYFIRNDEVNEIVIVEGLNEQHARERWEELQIDNSEFCECCGHRWGGYDLVMKEYHKMLRTEKHDSEGDVIIHFLDGTTKLINLDRWGEEFSVYDIIEEES